MSADTSDTRCLMGGISVNAGLERHFPFAPLVTQRDNAAYLSGRRESKYGG